jgi:hypothetical protein
MDPSQGQSNRRRVGRFTADRLTCFPYLPPDLKIRCATQTREYPTTGQVAVAPGVWLDAAVNGQSSGGWVDDHGVAEVFELGN